MTINAGIAVMPRRVKFNDQICLGNLTRYLGYDGYLFDEGLAPHPRHTAHVVNKEEWLFCSYFFLLWLCTKHNVQLFTSDRGIIQCFGFYNNLCIVP